MNKQKQLSKQWMEKISTERNFTVAEHRKKAEREGELKAKYDKLKQERIQRYQGVNLYVKNLDDSITDESLREAFKTFGSITSAKVITDLDDKKSIEKASEGTTVEEAAQADATAAAENSESADGEKTEQKKASWTVKGIRLCLFQLTRGG